MAKGCCFKAKARRRPSVSAEHPTHAGAHKHCAYTEAAIKTNGCVERDMISSIHRVPTPISSVPVHRETVNSPRTFPQTRVHPVVRSAILPSADVSASGTALLPNACSPTTLSHERSTSRIHQLISEESTSPIHGHSPEHVVHVVHGLTEENKDLYQATMKMLEEAPEWECGYESANPPSKLLYKMDPSNKAAWLYLTILLPCPLVASLAPTIEVDTWPKWHPYCTKHEMTGDASTWQCQTHYEQSLVFGLFKSDQNSRVYRWVNESEGFFLQRVTPVKPGDIGYVEPRLHRDLVEAAVMTASPSPHETLMVQLLRIEMPFAIPQFIRKFVLNTMAPKLIQHILTNAAYADDPTFPYKERIAHDVFGLYSYLHKMAQADAPKPMNIIADADAFLGGGVLRGQIIRSIPTETLGNNSFGGSCATSTLCMSMPPLISIDDTILDSMHTDRTSPGVFMQDAPHKNTYRGLDLMTY